MPAQSEQSGQNGAKNLESVICALKPETAAVLDRALSGEDITVEEAVVLFETEGQ